MSLWHINNSGPPACLQERYFCLFHWSILEISLTYFQFVTNELAKDFTRKNTLTLIPNTIIKTAQTSIYIKIFCLFKPISMSSLLQMILFSIGQYLKFVHWHFSPDELLFFNIQGWRKSSCLLLEWVPIKMFPHHFPWCVLS